MPYRTADCRFGGRVGKALWRLTVSRPDPRRAAGSSPGLDTLAGARYSTTETAPCSTTETAPCSTTETAPCSTTGASAVLDHRSQRRAQRSQVSRVRAVRVSWAGFTTDGTSAAEW